MKVKNSLKTARNRHKDCRLVRRKGVAWFVAQVLPGTRRPVVHLVAGAEQAQVVVEDQGIGIPESDHARIFEPFERGSNVGTIKGTGLGLNIVQRMTTLLTGTVAHTAGDGAGSRFTITLPRLPFPTSPS